MEAPESYTNFQDIKLRLDEIVAAVSDETMEFDQALSLYEEAVQLGTRASALIEQAQELAAEQQSAQDADLILFVYDVSTGLKKEDEEILNLIKDKKHIIIANKSDLVELPPQISNETLLISTQTGAGIEELKNKIKQTVCEFSSEELEFVTNKRQQDCLEKCKESLIQALTAAQIGELQDLISIDLKTALLYLDEITGEVITDEILNNIFDHFCIGK